ncbi:MAG: alpha/beta hydrolase [Pseudomonadota bacterium]
MDPKTLLHPEVAPSVELIDSRLEYINRDNLHEMREIVAGLHAQFREQAGDNSQLLDQSVREIDGEDGKIELYISQAKNRPNNGPAMLWIHGGGYISGSAAEVAPETLAHQCGATFVSVEYRLAPEHPFPAGLHDCHDALLWLHRNAAELGVDPQRLSIGGPSAGAGMAAGLALFNRDRKGPELQFQYLVYPMLDNLHDTLSGQQDGHPLWNRETSINAWEMYLDGTPGEQASPYAAAARAEDCSALPPAYVVVGGQDLFRDECIAYAQRLMAAGVTTELAVIPGLYHAAETICPDAPVSVRMQNSMLLALKNGMGL